MVVIIAVWSSVYVFKIVENGTFTLFNSEHLLTRVTSKRLSRVIGERGREWEIIPHSHHTAVKFKYVWQEVEEREGLLTRQPQCREVPTVSVKQAVCLWTWGALFLGLSTPCRRSAPAGELHSPPLPIPRRRTSGMCRSPRKAGKQGLQSHRVRSQISICFTMRNPGSGSCAAKHLMFLERVKAVFFLSSPPLPFPSSLNRSDCLAPSRHHLWLRVHLVWITIPPLDLWLTLTLSYDDESHFGRNDNEFEDKSWKKTLLWQLRFPCVIDKCDRVGEINCFFQLEKTEATEYIGCDLCCVTKLKIGLLDS